MRHQYLGLLLTRGVLQMARSLQLAGHQGGLHLQWLLALLCWQQARIREDLSASLQLFVEWLA